MTTGTSNSDNYQWRIRVWSILKNLFGNMFFSFLILTSSMSIRRKEELIPIITRKTSVLKSARFLWKFHESWNIRYSFIYSTILIIIKNNWKWLERLFFSLVIRRTQTRRKVRGTTWWLTKQIKAVGQNDYSPACSNQFWCY